MIELHRAAMTDALAVAGAGQRVHQLAQNLGFSFEEATRLGVAAQEMATKTQPETELIIELECKQEAARLILAFHGTFNTRLLESPAEKFFDTVQIEPGKVRVTRCLPDPVFKPEDEWVSKTQLWLSTMTFSELRTELQRKNAELSSLLSTLQEQAAAERRKSQELEEANKELERLREREYQIARFDSVTGLATRTLFRDRLEQSLTQARRHQHNLAVLFIDLDHFKQINDNLGHAAGDRTLREVGHRMINALRGSDTVARFGGDEFAIILRQLKHPLDAAKVARKLIEGILEPIDIEGETVSVGASIGIALYPDDGDSAEGLVESADEAMYEVKHGGRNSYRFSRENLNTLLHLPLRQGDSLNDC